MIDLAAGTLPRGVGAAASCLAADEWRSEVYQSVDQIASEWKNLEQRARRISVFQSQAWCGAWLEAIHQVGLEEEARVLTLRVRGRLVLLWPLTIRQVGPCRVLHALGEPATQYCDALIAADADRNAALAMAWSTIRTWRDVDLVEMRRVRSDAAIATLPPFTSAAFVHATAAPFVDLQIAGAAAHRSSRTRNALRRHRKKLAEHGEVSFELVEGTDAKIRVVEEAVGFKRRWMAERALWSDGYAHAAADAFTRPLAQYPNFRVARLALNKETIAVEAGYVLNCTYWSLTQSYDPRFARYAPGRLLTWQFIEHCVADGIRTLDFLAPAHDYKREWSTEEVAVADYLVPLTLKGSLLAAALGAARPALKRVYARLPAPLRDYIARTARGRR
jgi:CelD/BcsL family acetyltransferase involved in cellulose biosynthesis